MIDPLEMLSRRPDRVIGVCIVVALILIVVAAAVGSIIPLYVAAVPVAVLGLTRLASSGRDL